MRTNASSIEHARGGAVDRAVTCTKPIAETSFMETRWPGFVDPDE